MLVLVTYDVNTQEAEGRSRLRKVARICMNHGIRVQNSVFECRITPAERAILESDLRFTIDEEKDSIRIYDLGAFQTSKITHIGTKMPLDPEGTLLF